METTLIKKNMILKEKVARKKHLIKKFKDSIPLYVFLLPAVIFLILFHYKPIYGIQIAFRDYTIRDGITGSEWVGLKHFITFINSQRFWLLIKNTLVINFFSLLTFPLPIVLAVLLNYCPSLKVKKTVQMVTYAPYFISIVVLVSMITIFLSPSLGFINKFIELFGFRKVNFLMVPEYFKYIYVVSGLWQTAGWSSIIYIGALASISQELHEAATVDGATKIKRIWHIDLPGISNTIIIMLIMKIGSMMNLGFQKIFLMQNDANLITSEVISTYVYKVGLIHSNFSYSTAIELFNTVINILLLITANKAAKKIFNTGLF